MDMCEDCKHYEDFLESSYDVREFSVCARCIDRSNFESKEFIPDQSNTKHVLDITMADGSKYHLICFGSPVVHDNWLVCQADETSVKTRAFNINYIIYWNVQPLSDNEEVLLN